jgi:LysW-gamma-L-lysine carboxypeptidase
MTAFDLLHRIVGIPSPTGSERAVVDALVDQAKKDGLTAHRDGVGNFVAEAGRGSKLLLFVGHVDTVEGVIPVRIEDGTLHGRGSVDAKSPLVAFYAAAREFLRDDRLRIRIVGAIDEEGDSRGAKNMQRSEEPSWIVVGEPSGSDGVTLGYKGILRGRLHIKRPHRHGAHASPSAADELVKVWGEIAHTFDFQERFEQIQGRLLEFASRNDGLTDHAVARFALRLPPGITTTRTAKRLQDVAVRHGAEVEFAEMMDAALVDKKGPLVGAYLSSIRAEGAKPRLKQKTGTADFNLLHQWYPRVPIVAYGPGDASLDHTPEERIPRAEFERGVRVNRLVIERLAATVDDRPAPSLAAPKARPGLNRQG